MTVKLSAESEALAIEVISTVGRLASNPFAGMGSAAPSREEVEAVARLQWEQNPKLREAFENRQAYVAGQLMAAGYSAEPVPLRPDWLHPDPRVPMPAMPPAPKPLEPEAQFKGDWLHNDNPAAETVKRGLWGSELPAKKPAGRSAAGLPWQPGEVVGGPLGASIKD